MWAALTDTWTNDVRNKTLPGGSQIKTKPLSIPSSYSYNIGNFLAPSMSYLTPNSCKTAWAFSVIQMLADRQNKNSNGTRPIKLSVQALLNCGIGTC